MAENKEDGDLVWAARLKLRETIMNDIVRPTGGPSLWPAIDRFAQAIEELVEAKLKAMGHAPDVNQFTDAARRNG